MWLCWKNKDNSLIFSELINLMSRTYFCVKSQVYVLNLVPGGASTMKKAGKSEHARF